jgi:hypothetical protein
MQHQSPDRSLSSELERAALRAILETYEQLNYTFFRRTLRKPQFELSDAAGRLGRWVRSHRTLELSRSLLAVHGWGVLVEVLKHEMAHQYVDEVLGHHAEPAHGPAFRKVCHERAIDARAAGAPAGAAVVPDEARLLERVAKLLALAESPNLHEAQAAMSAAQRLMLKYNLETVASSSARAYGFRHLGKPSGRVSESERLLAGLLAEHFFVEVIWVRVWRVHEARRGSVLEICGTPENVELGAYVHSFLTHTAERLWREYKRSRGIERNANRRTFLAGVISGFRDKLLLQRSSNREQGLVWVGDAGLGEFFRRRHPRLRWTRRAGSIRGEAWRHGREAGQRIVLHRGVSAGASTGSRLLPGRRDN